MRLTLNEWELFGVFFYGVLSGIGLGICIAAFIVGVIG